MLFYEIFLCDKIIIVNSNKFDRVGFGVDKIDFFLCGFDVFVDFFLVGFDLK